ncbi:MAG: nucleotide exchange factor GrpE [Solirubrobacteraceae bacterium]
MSTGGFAGAPLGGGVPERESAADGAQTSPATAAGAAAAYAAAASGATAVASSGPDPVAPEPARQDEPELVVDPDDVVEEVVTATATQPAADEQVVLDIEELSVRAERADEYLELAQRVRADFENYRKRAAREAAAAQERGVAKLAKELLAAIDNLDRAVQAAPSPADAAAASDAAADSQLISGIKLVHADVLAALARVGIERFSPEGEQFDPTYHEAVAQAPIAGAASGSVVEVYQCGYRIGENVLRPARVLVAA